MHAAGACDQRRDIKNIAALRHRKILIENLAAADLFKDLPRRFGFGKAILARLQSRARVERTNHQKNPFRPHHTLTC